MVLSLIMGEPEIDIAIKAFEEIRVNTDHADLKDFNLAVGLLALARAVKEIRQEVEATKRGVSLLQKEIRNLKG